LELLSIGLLDSYKKASYWNSYIHGQYNCIVTIYSGSDKKIVIISSGQRHHVGNSPSRLERQVLHEYCKRRAEESLSTQPLKLIKNEILNNLEQSLIFHKYLKTVRKAMYEKRWQILPKLPKSPE